MFRTEHDAFYKKNFNAETNSDLFIKENITHNIMHFNS